MSDLFAKVVLQQSVDFILPSLAKGSEIKVMERNIRISRRIIDKFSYQCMYMRIPIKCSSKGVKCGNHFEFTSVIIVTEKIQIVMLVLKNSGTILPSFDFFKQVFINFFTDSKCKVQEETEAILSLLRNSHTRYIGFFWGTKMCYIGSIISAQATYTMFHRDGSPCRSRINLQILTVENSIPAGFRNQWVDKYMAFRETDKNRLVRWGENGIAGNFVNIPF